MVVSARTASETVLWHDLECGAYAADLPLWRELTDAARAVGSGAVLDVGAGTGRVTLALARAGHAVTALDVDGVLLGALRERAAAITGARVDCVRADARELALERRDFGACIVPMQTLQLLGGRAGRRRFLACAHAHLAPGATLACAIVTRVEEFDCAAGDPPLAPELARVGAATYASRPTRVRVDERSVLIERERSVIGAGARAPERDVVELDRVGVAQLQREARAAGFAPAGTRTISETAEHAGSVVVLAHA